MQDSIEAITARLLVHRDTVAKTLERTGGEVMHPDHYDIREAMRLAVLGALDQAALDCECPKMSDAELPDLFKAIDAIAQRVWLKPLGL